MTIVDVTNPPLPQSSGLVHASYTSSSCDSPYQSLYYITNGTTIQDTTYYCSTDYRPFDVICDDSSNCKTSDIGYTCTSLTASTYSTQSC
eukprot:gene7032-8176_t